MFSTLHAPAPQESRHSLDELSGFLQTALHRFAGRESTGVFSLVAIRKGCLQALLVLRRPELTRCWPKAAITPECLERSTSRDRSAALAA